MAITGHLLPVAHNLVDPHRSCNLDKTRFGTPFCCLLFVLGSRSGWARQHSASSSLSQCCSRWLEKTQSRSSASLSEGKCYNVQSSNCSVFLPLPTLGLCTQSTSWPGLARTCGRAPCTPPACTRSGTDRRGTPLTLHWGMVSVTQSHFISHFGGGCTVFVPGTATFIHPI